MSNVETPLVGGRITAGVVRIGDTVRRPISGDRSNVHALLTHLEEQGFDGTPRLLGIDDQNREILSFLPGAVPRDLGHFTDMQLAGLRLWDLGYSAFAWLDLGNPAYTGDEQVRRLRVFADGYGMPACSAAQIAAYAIARQTALASWARSQGKTDMADWAASAASWTVHNVTEQLLPTGFPRPDSPSSDTHRK